MYLRTGAWIPKIGIVLSYLLLGVFVICSLFSFPKFRATAAKNDVDAAQSGVTTAPHEVAETKADPAVEAEESGPA